MNKELSKEKFFKFFSFLKNPLWIIVILLIVMIFLLRDIREELYRIYGHLIGLIGY
jgi:hypothetical protein